MAELVPRQDLVQAIALNGVGFNIARAVGPALAGFMVLFGGPALTFGLYAASYLAIVAALLSGIVASALNMLPREHFLSAMRVGIRFVRFTPAMRAAMVRSAAYLRPGLRPLGAAAAGGARPSPPRRRIFGVLLGRWASVASPPGCCCRRCARHSAAASRACSHRLLRPGMALLALSSHWLRWRPSAMLLFGVGWVAASSVIQGAAQLPAPPWVRLRAPAFYQVGFEWRAGWRDVRLGMAGHAHRPARHAAGGLRH